MPGHIWTKIFPYSGEQSFWKCDNCAFCISFPPSVDQKFYVYSDPLFDIEVFGPFTCQEIIIWNITES